MGYNKRRLLIAQHVLANPLSTRHEYLFFIESNPFSVGNKEKRESCVLDEKDSIAIQALTKQELIHELNLASSNRFREYSSESFNRTRFRIRLIKKALKLNMSNDLVGLIIKTHEN